MGKSSDTAAARRMTRDWTTVPRRMAAALTVALLAAGAVLAVAPGSAAGAARDSRGAPVKATDAEVEQALGVGQVPAAIVLIVDVSYSMDARHHNLYGTVFNEVTSLLGYLASHEPQDRVAVIQLGNMQTTQVLYPLGAPQTAVGLPSQPKSGESDFGYAFSLAARQLASASSDIKVGQVLLFSDGDVTEPASDDPAFAASNTNFSGAGWKPLSAQVRELRDQQDMTIVAYDVPLTVASASGQHNALSQVFPSVQTLPGDNPGATLASVKSGILDSKIAGAAAADSGAGVQAIWDLPNASLDFRQAGHLDATVILTARTQKIPLYATGLSVTSTGLPATLRASLPDEELPPGGTPVRVPVHLSWYGGSSQAGLAGGTATVHGDLVLHATVLSSFTSALRGDFNDTRYSPGGLRGGVSRQLTAITAESAAFLLLILIIAVVVLLLGCALVFLTWMRGTLVLTSVHQVSDEVALRGPWVTVSTNDLIGVPGRMRARGTLRRRVRVDMRLEGKPPGEEIFEPGDRKMAAGVWVEYYGPDEHRGLPSTLRAR